MNPNRDHEPVIDGREYAEEIPDGWTPCPYCGELVELPARYCCEEHEEGRRLA